MHSSQTPLFAGDESLWAVIGMAPHQGRLPPLVIAAIQDVEDVTVLEGESLGGTVVVLAGVVVKQSSVSVCMGREEEHV